MSLRPAQRSRTSESGIADRHLRQQQPLTPLNSAVLAPMPSAEREDDDGRPALGVEQHADRVAKILEHSHSSDRKPVRAGEL